MLASTSLAQVNAIATDTVSTAWVIASAFLILLVLTGLLFVYSWYIGGGPLMALLLSFYAAYALYIAFPYANLLPSAPPLTALLAHAGFYLAIVFVFYVVMRRIVVSEFLYIGVVGLLVLSFLGASFLVALGFHVFPVTTLYHFSPAISALFGPDKYFFWWFVAPAIGLFFLAR